MIKQKLTLVLYFSFLFSFSQDYKLYSNIIYNKLKNTKPNLQSLDIYTPKNSIQHKIPVIIYIHGGAWRAGDKLQPQSSHYKYFTQQGYIFVSINYRLSPKPYETNWLKPDRIKSPTHAYDVAKAVAWTIDNIEKYGGNPDSISIMGHSAGAHLAMLVSTNEQFLNKYNKSISQIKCACSLDVAAFNLVLLLNSIPKKDLPTLENAFSTNTNLLKEASPALQINSKEILPEFLLIHRNQQMVKDQNIIMLNKLLKNGHTATRIQYNLKHLEINTLLGIDEKYFIQKTSKTPTSPNALDISTEYTLSVTNFLKQCLKHK